MQCVRQVWGVASAGCEAGVGASLDKISKRRVGIHGFHINIIIPSLSLSLFLSAGRYTGHISSSVRSTAETGPFRGEVSACHMQRMCMHMCDCVCDCVCVCV